MKVRNQRQADIFTLVVFEMAQTYKFRFYSTLIRHSIIIGLLHLNVNTLDPYSDTEMNIFRLWTNQDVTVF